MSRYEGYSLIASSAKIKDTWRGSSDYSLTSRKIRRKVLFLTTREAAWYVILVVWSVCRVCMYVCQTIICDMTYRKFIIYTCRASPRTTGWVRIRRSSGQGQSHGSQKGRKILFPQCKTSTGNNSRSIKYRAVMFACSIGFSGTADQMV